MKKLAVGLAAILLMAMPATTFGAQNGETDGAMPAPRGIAAWYKGHWIDLGRSWEGAQACNVTDDGVVCYETEDEMDQAIGPMPAGREVGGGSASGLLTTCSSYVRLYDGISFVTPVLSLNTRFTYLNLSTYGFDNTTSSYKIGACDSDFFSASGGGGSLYPGDTTAFVWSASMVFGWDNVVSSIYIY